MIIRKIVIATTFAIVSSSAICQQSAYSITRMKLVTADAGWAASQRQLFTTLNYGITWSEITPADARTKEWKIASVAFVDMSSGWVLLSSPDATGDSSEYKLATTRDGGSTWVTSNIIIPNLLEGAETPDGKGEIAFTDAQSGWINISLVSSSNFRRGLLLRTDDGGVTWQRPASDPQISGNISFISKDHGWLAGGGGHQQLEETRDGGRSWKRIVLASPSSPNATIQTSYDTPVFKDNGVGELRVTFSGSEDDPEVVRIYSTTDSGRTWSLRKRVAPIHAEAQGGVPTTIVKGSSISSLISVDGQVDQKREPADSYQSTTNPLLVSSLSFASDSQGWAIVAGTGCELNRSQCGQISHLVATRDGGASWADVTPSSNPISPMRELGSVRLKNPDTDGIEEVEPSATSSTAAASYGTHVSEHLGFDRCDFPTSSKMSDWWKHSPFFVYGLYIGGVDETCKTPIPPSWVSAVVQQGWGLIPIWVGQQAPCLGGPNLFSNNPTIAGQRGAYEAAAAIAKANGLGFSKSIIYYDLEGYPPGVCGTAVRAFLNAWVSTLKASGFKAGIYVNSKNTSDFTALTKVPDDVWVAKYTPPAVTTWGMSPLCDIYSPASCKGPRLWSNQQRIRQYDSDLTSTYGTTQLDYDPDIINATISGGQGVKPYTYVLKAFDYDAGNSFNTNILGINDEPVLIGNAAKYVGTSLVYYSFSTELGGTTTVLPGYPGVPAYATQYISINNLSQSSGYDYTYSEGSDYLHGFLYAKNKFTAINPPGSTASNVTGINDAGQMVGTYASAGPTPTVNFFNNQSSFGPVPKAPTGSVAWGINGNTDFAGYYLANGFTLINGILNPIAVANNYVDAFGINANAEASGSYRNLTEYHNHGFVYHQGKMQILDYPGSTQTSYYGINDFGILAGTYVDSTSTGHGVVAVPQ